MNFSLFRITLIAAGILALTACGGPSVPPTTEPAVPSREVATPGGYPVPPGQAVPGGYPVPPGQAVPGGYPVPPGQMSPGSYPGPSGQGVPLPDVSSMTDEEIMTQAAQLADTGQAPQALGMLNAAIARKSSSELLISRARVLIRLGNFVPARSDLETVLQQEPNNLDARLVRGILFSQLMAADLALEDLNAVLQAEPQNVEALTERSAVYRQSDQIDKAVADADAALAAQPDYAPAYGARARAHMKTDKIEQAKADFARAIELDPGRVGITFDYGMFLLGQGDPEGARQQFEAVLQNGITGRDSLTMFQASQQLQFLQGQ